jgi:hypothetical protein
MSDVQPEEPVRHAPISLSGGPPFKFFTATALTTETTVWTPATGTRWRLTGMAVAVSAICYVTIRDNTGGSTVFVLPLMAANTPYIIDLGAGILSAAVNNVLTMQSSAAANISGTLFGRDE